MVSSSRANVLPVSGLDIGCVSLGIFPLDFLQNAFAVKIPMCALYDGYATLHYTAGYARSAVRQRRGT